MESIGYIKKWMAHKNKESALTKTTTAQATTTANEPVLGASRTYGKRKHSSSEDVKQISDDQQTACFKTKSDDSAP